ncbi:MAG: alkylphosphonate utilization protein [Bacteroidia bacterium]
MEVRDSNGSLLSEGDNVTLIKDLKLRGSSAVLKRGTMVKGIRLTDDASEVEGRVERQTIVLRTEFMKKA